MSKYKKLKNYNGIVTLAQEMIAIKTINSSFGAGLFYDQSTKKNIVDALVKKYANIMSEEELNILELNLYINNNLDFKDSMNNLCRDLFGFEEISELLKENNAEKIATLVNKLSSYYSVDKKMIIRKIKEVVIYKESLINYSKKKIK